MASVEIFQIYRSKTSGRLHQVLEVRHNGVWMRPLYSETKFLVPFKSFEKMTRVLEADNHETI